MARRTKTLLALSAPFALLLLTCSGDYNPFADALNARAVVVARTFDDGDTVAVFSGETLTVELAVAALIDSFRLDVPGNRVFKDSTIVREAFGPPGSAYRFRVSLSRTGPCAVTLSTFRRNGDVITERFGLYATLPLSQSAVNGTLGNPVSLHTPAVGDADVLYHWDFGMNATVSSLSPDTAVVVYAAAMSGDGRLWVADLHDPAVCSDTVLFPFTFNDNAGPDILILADSIRGDTIVTGLTEYIVTAVITDLGSADISGATINSLPFDAVSPPYYRTRMYRLDTLAGPKPLAIVAYDRSRNPSSRAAWLVYDASLVSAVSARIVVDIPPRDRMVSSSRSVTVAGRVENIFSTGDLYVRMRVGDSLYPEPAVVNAVTGARWSFRAWLDSTSNTVTLTVTTGRPDSIAGLSFTMLFDPNAPDTAAPSIIEVLADNRPAGGLTVDRDTVTLTVIGFDEGSGVGPVTIGGAAATADSGGAYRWSAPAALRHFQTRDTGNVVAVTITDLAGLDRDTAVTLFYNRLPAPVEAPAGGGVVTAGQTYTAKIVIADPDGDPVSATIEKSGPAGGTVTLSGTTVTWQTTVADTGTDTITVVYSDRMGIGAYRWTVRVVPSSALANAVSFQTAESDFPAFLETGRDSLVLQLALVQGGGLSPFTFSAVETRSLTQVASAQTGLIRWVPAPADTGTAIFLITVSDAAGAGDTLRPRVLVVPQNRACSLSISSTQPLLAGAVLDLRQSAFPETLTFRVIDPDLAPTESHAVTISRGGLTTAGMPDSTGNIVVIIDPRASTVTVDTVIVRVTDRAGHAFSSTVTVWYPLTPVRPKNPAPADGSADTDTAVTLSWTGDTLAGVRYAVFLDAGAGPVPVAAGLMLPSFTLHGLNCDRAYGWSVIASTPWRSTAGPVWRFTTKTCVQQFTGKKIYVNTVSAGVSENLVDFPLLVRLSAPAVDFSAFRGDGGNARFVKTDGTPLGYEIEHWDSAAGQAAVWVRVDTIFGGSTTRHFLLQADAAQAPNLSAGSTVFRPAGGFGAVVHAKDTLTRSPETFEDATGNGNTVRPWTYSFGSTNTTGYYAPSSGPVGGCLLFNQSNDMLFIANNQTVNPAGDMTVSCWVSVNGTYVGFQPGAVMFDRTSANRNNSSWLSYMLGVNTGNRPRFEWSGGNAINTAEAAQAIPAGTWSLVTGVRTGAALRLFVNGRIAATTSVQASATAVYADWDLRIGGENVDVYKYYGSADELRVESTARSDGWILMCYENQKPGSTVVTVGE